MQCVNYISKKLEKVFLARSDVMIKKFTTGFNNMGVIWRLKKVSVEWWDINICLNGFKKECKQKALTA